jgi:Skp family chaperone for outer membrane proteins
VKKSLFWAVPAAVLSLCVYCSLGLAQAPSDGPPPIAGPTAVQPTQPAATRIALIDVTFIFKNHKRFKDQMQDMKGQVQAAENRVKTEKQQITTMAQTLQTLQKGTADYKDLEEKITDLSTRLQISVNKEKSAFLQQQARIYYNTYQEICQSTDYFCRQYGIDLVLRHSRETANPDNPDDVLTVINKPVVFQRGLDITDQILADLNRSSPAAPGTADRRGMAPPRPASPFGNPRELDPGLSPPR